MGGKTSKDATGKGAGEEEEVVVVKATKDEEDTWFSTLSKQEGDAKYNTSNRSKAQKKTLQDVFKGNNNPLL